MNLNSILNDYLNDGSSNANANAISKVCQDIIRLENIKDNKVKVFFELNDELIK